MWQLKYEKRVQKDLDKLKQCGLIENARRIIEILKNDPYATPNCKKLVGDFKGLYSRRINLTHRVVYKVLDREKTVLVISMWGHYDD